MNIVKLIFLLFLVETCKCFSNQQNETNFNMVTSGQQTDNRSIKLTENKDAMFICGQPQKTGPCRAYIPRWYFNASTKTCAEFIYGGCDGNGNNFKSLEECINICSPPQPQTENDQRRE